MKKYFSFFLVLFCSTTLFAQKDNDFPALTLNDLPGGKILRQSYFNGTELWGHIDGGADLYLEYGFDKLLFQDVVWHSYSFRVEYYRMIDEESAFGIFSVSNYKCSFADTLTKYICITPYQVQSALGRFYISIANEKGTPEAQKLTIQLFEMILSKNKEHIYSLPNDFISAFNINEPVNFKLIKGKLGIQNGFPEWEEMFVDFSNYKIIIAEKEEDKSNTILSKIIFNNNESLINFLKQQKFSYSSNGKYYLVQNEMHIKEIQICSENSILYEENNDGKILLK